MDDGRLNRLSSTVPWFGVSTTTCTDGYARNTFPQSSKTTSPIPNTNHLPRLSNLHCGIPPAKKNTTACALSPTPKPTYFSSASPSTVPIRSKMSWIRYRQLACHAFISVNPLLTLLLPPVVPRSPPLLSINSHHPLRPEIRSPQQAHLHRPPQDPGSDSRYRLPRSSRCQ